MRALLLAAGMGTRLRPITDSIPKCLVPVHGRPLLDYWLENLFNGGIERVLVNTHWLAEKVEAHVAASAWRNDIDLVFELSLLGTGGTILANRDWFGKEPFLVGHADNLTDFDLAELRAAHANRPAGCLMTMLAFRADDPQSCGILELDSRGVVMAFHEKVPNPPGNLANAAVYILEPAVLDIVAAHGKREVDLSTEVMPELLGRIIAVETDRYHRDIGTPESLRRANTEYKRKPGT